MTQFGISISAEGTVEPGQRTLADAVDEIAEFEEPASEPVCWDIDANTPCDCVDPDDGSRDA